MTLDRRKVLIYLRPDISASERFADAKIEAHHRGDRGDMSRTALLAGLALGEVDSRLPSMLGGVAGGRYSNRKRCVRCWPRSLRSSRPLPPRQPRQRPLRLRRRSRPRR